MYSIVWFLDNKRLPLTAMGVQHRVCQAYMGTKIRKLNLEFNYPKLDLELFNKNLGIEFIIEV